MKNVSAVLFALTLATGCISDGPAPGDESDGGPHGNPDAKPIGDAAPAFDAVVVDAAPADGAPGEGGTGCWPAFEACDPGVAAAFETLPPIDALPDERVEGTFAGLDGTAILIQIGSETLSVDAGIDPTPLASVLSVGEAIVAEMSETNPGPQVLTVTRASDGALLAARMRRTANGTPGYPPVLEGVGADIEPRVACGFLHEVGFDCPPHLMDGYDLAFVEDDGSDTVVPLQGTATVETASGSFQVQNLASAGMTSVEATCAICAEYIAEQYTIDLVRLP